MTERCNGWCKWLREEYNLPNRYAFRCQAADDQVVASGKSAEPMTGKLRSEVRIPIVAEQSCLAPEKREAQQPENLPFGGMDPFAV
jgi:hypothetical protein